MGIDESGQPSDDVFVIAGVLLGESSMHLLKRIIDEVKARHGVPPDAELHAKDIVHGKGAYSGLRDFSARRRLLEDALSILSRLEAVAVAVVGYGPAQSPERGLAIAFRYLLERGILAFNKVAGPHEHLFIVIDETYYRNDWARMRIVEAEVLEGFYTKRWPVIERVMSRPIFMPSQREPLLQLADLVAYTVRRAVALSRGPRRRDPLGLLDLYSNYVEPVLDRCRDGRIRGCGLKEFRAV